MFVVFVSNHAVILDLIRSANNLLFRFCFRFFIASPFRYSRFLYNRFHVSY
jgi:hypothetical protein